MSELIEDKEIDLSQLHDKLPGDIKDVKVFNLFFLKRGEP